MDQIIETVKSVAFHRLLLSGSRPHDISFNFKHAQNFARNVGVIIHYTKKELDSFHCLWCATSSTAVWQSKAAVTLFEVLACIIYRSDYNDLLSMYLNHRFRESSSYHSRLTASSAILKPIFAKKLLQLGDFALQQQWFFHVIPMETLTGYNLT